MGFLKRRFQNHFSIIKIAFPAILANASAPLLGLVDTGAIGQTGNAADLGAIALGSLIFSFVYWGFGFLRMSTTGFIAQAAGAGNQELVRTELFRALLLGTVIGLLLVVFQYFIGGVSLGLMGAGIETKELVSVYFHTRIWAAPATLCTFALLGALIGLGYTKKLLAVQLFLNLLNLLLNLFFVLVLQWGVKGIALGTLIAEISAFCLALFMVMRCLEIKNFLQVIRANIRNIVKRSEVFKMLRVNTDIMIRTFALLAGFAWFTNQGALFGAETLAANHILLQFISLSAFFLDGYAYVVEMLIGKATGAGNKDKLLRQVRDSTELAGVTALCLALLIFLTGYRAIELLTSNANIRAIADRFVTYAAIYVFVSFVAFQLDGIFIGSTRSREMRNATLLSLGVFLLSAHLLLPWQNQGLWTAFIIYVIARGVFLGVYFPRVLKGLP